MIKIRGKPPLTYKFVKNEIEKESYKLLSNKYLNSKSKLELECPQGHIYKVTYNAFQQGQRCPYCLGRIVTYKHVKKEIEKTGYKLLSKIYKNNHTNLKIKCNNGHIYKAPWNRFSQNIRCPICDIIRHTGKNHPNWKGGDSVTWYNTYASQIKFCEKVKRDPENNDLLQVRCTNSNCKKWFNPSYKEVSRRILALNKNSTGEHRFYCSEECKQSCSLYHRRKYPKGFKLGRGRPDQKD